MSSKTEYFPPQQGPYTGRPSSSRPPPPPLPPRQSATILSPYAEAPPPYSALEDARSAPTRSWSAQDPRSSSTHSLVPAEDNPQNERRKLLLIYVHGFMGNETSFQSFPAHVHNLVTVTLAETHVVHTKIYPRYRSRSINFDVPFLGMHPGIIKSGLASIFKPAPPTPGRTHTDSNNLEIKNHDLASPNQTSLPTALSPQRTDTLFSSSPLDPNYNPSFNNDVVLPMRKGWKNAWHFVNKHSNDLTKATKQLVTSHMEFGGAMADYKGLKARYGKIRALEEQDIRIRDSVMGGAKNTPRVRFVNYYTASTGRPKRSESPNSLGLVKSSSRTTLEVPGGSTQQLVVNERARSPSTRTASSRSASRSPRISVEEHRDDEVIEKVLDEPEDSDYDFDMNHLDPRPVSSDSNVSGYESWADAADSFSAADVDRNEPGLPAEDTSTDSAPTQTLSTQSTMLSPQDSTLSLSSTTNLPSVPDVPLEPPKPDLSAISDKDTRKLAEKEYARALKAYQKAVKDREKVIKNRAKLEEKKAKKMLKEIEKQQQDMAKQVAKRKQERVKTMEKAVDEDEKVAKKEHAEWEKARQEGKVEAQDESHGDEEVNEMAGIGPLTREAIRLEHEAEQSAGEDARLKKEAARMKREEARMNGEDRQATAPARPAAPKPTATRTPSTKPSLIQTTSTTSTASPVLSPSSTRHPLSPTTSKPTKLTKPHHPPKDRKFCLLPPKDSKGNRDPCWVRIFMRDMDEVSAHCGLFFVSETYERLVGDVAERVEGWVKDAEGERVAREIG
ncbi:hypothetical protein LTR50_007483 [Elasticomyces elasticus]|nr:hypothetical protein LTR50_007483 [Elasticomyces elasticus]